MITHTDLLKQQNKTKINTGKKQTRREWERERVRESEREREREGDRETEIETDRNREREREKEIERDRDRERQRQTGREHLPHIPPNSLQNRPMPPHPTSQMKTNMQRTAQGISVCICHLLYMLPHGVVCHQLGHISGQAVPGFKVGWQSSLQQHSKIRQTAGQPWLCYFKCRVAFKCYS